MLQAIKSANSTALRGLILPKETVREIVSAENGWPTGQQTPCVHSNHAAAALNPPNLPTL
jgi:hypothetical protein